MPQYKQTLIPSVTTERYKALSQRELRATIRREYTEKIQGKSVENKHIGLTIYFGSDGKAELSSGRAVYSKKAAVVQCLPELLKHAVYNNFGNRKPNDPKSIFGYANFKAKVKIDGHLECVRITVIVKANGKAYYCHEISIKKE